MRQDNNSILTTAQADPFLTKRYRIMKLLNIQQHGAAFIAGSSETVDEIHNLSGTIFDLWASGSDLISDEDVRAVFEFDEFSYQSQSFEASWNSDLRGYVLVFADGKSAKTYIETNKLHADFGGEYLERYTEFDNELSEEQHALVDDFVAQINKIKSHFS
jgi:hypothetical protein